MAAHHLDNVHQFHYPTSLLRLTAARLRSFPLEGLVERKKREAAAEAEGARLVA